MSRGRRSARVGWRALVSAGALIALLAGQLPSGAQQNSREEELERIRGEIARLQAQFDQAKQKESGLSGDLERTSAELALQEQRVAEAAAAHELAAGKAAESEARVADLEHRLEQIRSELRGSLIGLYRMGRNGYLRLFLALKPSESLLPGIRLLRFVARRDANALDSFRETETRLNFERDGLVKERQEVDAWVDREQSRRTDLLRLRGRQTELLAGARSEQNSLTERRGELEEREKKLSSSRSPYRDAKEFAGKPLEDFRAS